MPAQVFSAPVRPPHPQTHFVRIGVILFQKQSAVSVYPPVAISVSLHVYTRPKGI